jgi:hypothetical protein
MAQKDEPRTFVQMVLKTVQKLCKIVHPSYIRFINSISSLGSLRILYLLLFVFQNIMYALIFNKKNEVQL